MVLLTGGSSVQADEGMWLFSAPPAEQLRSKYGFELSEPWIEHLMKASVRFNSGGSGSFVSADGLVITNHHVASDDLQKISDETNNYLRDGFYARTLAEEKKLVDLELNVLQSIEDVTDRVNAGVPAGATGEAAAAARRKVIAEIEAESLERTGLRSDVVTLYQGGAYHLYRFKRYTDVRLVWAPEQQIAFFGGDPDNFEFPRYCLDATVYRVYENDRPAKIEHYLEWSEAGTREGDLIFVSGHPGSTSRQLTMAELESLRDVQYPYVIPRIKRIEVLLRTWGDRSAENARRAGDLLLSFQNSRKVYDGRQSGLYSPAIMGPKAAEENSFRLHVRDRADSADVLKAYQQIEQAVADQAKIYRRYRLLEGGHAFMSESFGLARSLLRAAEERAKPSGERLREFGEARRASFELSLFSDQPIHTDLEIILLADGLTLLAEEEGFETQLVQRVLNGQSPRERAAALINGTKVRDVEFRRKLYEGGAKAVQSAEDPLIELARLVDQEARELRRQWEASDEVKQQAHATIAKARFAVEGATRAPDATFTLRLSYGAVRGYEDAGQSVKPYTTFAGLYERNEEHENRPPFDLPQRWIEKRGALDLTVPFNFVSTPDIIGGNSGSPVVNRAGEFVGIIFDGNLYSLVGDFAYEDVQARALSVDARGIIEAMRKVYGVEPLVQELLAGRRQ